MYIVSTPQALDLAPIDDARLAGWIDRVPAIRVDGQAATVENLRARLDSFWIPGETVVYIGRATTSLATRIGQYYRTPLGDRAPHAGGHWIKTLSILDWLNSSGPQRSRAAR